ncbi:hypothetical protein FDENT_1405 [Fusarium denticulatum]|uniref:Major facilitator superfamily (MFS) profile domain-containing protein n=1 Tax=Fusarium denticulatum TaxID=48507 RepID=A0A8H5XIG6_9HYPO|nr:hypothetical protein FDENT_1405 [Fusarium denticulatum]
MSQPPQTSQPSPGNQLYPDMPAMRAPGLEFVYRLVAKMHPTNGYDIENIQGTGITRSIAGIESGTVKGPGIEGTLVENSGADWAEQVHSKKVGASITYTRHCTARGLFRPGPGIEFSQPDSIDVDYTQDEVEYFTHITFEAAGNSPYNWMNGIVAIGALQSYGGAAVIDCWRLTNFLGQKVEDVYLNLLKRHLSSNTIFVFSMPRKVAPAPPDFTTPPGTVRLIGEDGIAETPQLVKQPMPTDDPNDPLNWSRARKSMNFVPILAVTAIIFTQTSLPLIFWVLWNQEFGWSYGQLNNANALNYVGTTVGCILFIPPAVKYGRRSMYLLTTAIIFAMAIWSARMKTLTELYVSQFIFGLASATNESIVEMTIADLYFVHQRGSANGLYMVMVMIGSFLSPVIAGYMAANGNWRLCYWITTAVDGALLLYFCFFFEESKYIPRLEAQQLSSEVPTPIPATKKDNISETQTGEMSTCVTLETSIAPLHRINSDIPLLTWRQRMRLVTKTDESLLGIVRTAVVTLFRFPAVMYTALTYAFCLCWISAQASIISIVFTQPPYNFGTVGVGNMSLGVFIGCILGSAYGAISDRAILWFTRKNFGYYEPEMRLQLNHFPAVCMSGGFIMFGITTAKGMHWIYPSIGSAVFGFGLGGLSDVALCVTIDSYQAITGEAFIGVAFIRNAFSIAISFALVPWLDAQGLLNMTIVMGLWALAMAFLHVPMMIWGKRIREKTEASYKRMATGTRV